MKKILTCIAGMGFFCAVYSQTYKQGEAYPGFSTKEVFNYTADSLNLENFAGKLIIFDFWSHSCLSCIKDFPKLDSIQKKFSDKIQIILVSKEGKDTTKRFLARRPKIKIPNIPFVTGDSILSAQFPHTGVPFHVWIDSSRHVRSLTRGHNTSYEKVKAYFANPGVLIPSYKPTNYIETLFDSRWDNKIQYASYIALCTGDDARLGATDNEHLFRLSALCASVTELYQSAYDPDFTYEFKRPGRTIVHVSDSFRYIRPKDENLYEEWSENYSYSYMVSFPKTLHQDKYELMRQDLDRYFGLRATIETKMIESYVLIRTSSIDKLKTKGGAKQYGFYWEAGKHIIPDSIRTMTNYDFSFLTRPIRFYIERTFHIPFADATGYKGSIDFRLDGTVIEQVENGNISGLKKVLQSYDLDIVKKKMPLKVLVLRESK